MEANQEQQSLNHDLAAEIREQRRDSLRGFAVLQIVVGLLWLVFVSWEDAIGISSLPTYVAWIGACFAYSWADRNYHLACWTLLSTLTMAISAVVLFYPVPVVALSGVLTVIAANALFKPKGSLTIALLSWLSMNAAWQHATGDLYSGWMGAGGLALYGMVWSASYLVGRPLVRSVESALTGWTQARQALREVQERRGELYRVVRALEEATYRIERTNNELLISRAQAENARAFKSRFAATVSHEIRGPLNLLIGFSRMIALYPEKYGEPLPDAYLADIDAIHRNCEHLGALVDDVLDLSQIEAESLPLVRDRVDLRADVIDQIVQSTMPLAKRKGLFFHVQVDDGLPVILADPVRVRQVLLNLLTNAIRFTRRGGITVRAWVEGSLLYTSVQDTGPGIPSNDLPNLFREFSQILNTETREGAGSGLGLAISKKLVELHGGEMWVESTEEAGTTFVYTLPLPGVALGALRGSALGRQPHGALPKSCLIVHDDANVVRLLARYLEDHRVIGVPNPHELATLVADTHPRAIITTDEWREQVLVELDKTSFDVPVFSLGIPHSSVRHHLKGVLGYLVKPISPEMLWSVMKNYAPEGELQVLIVDDDPDAVRLMHDMLTLLPHPYQIHAAYGGLQALEIMQTVTPDIVFMDLRMGDMGGEETIDRMREMAPLRSVPVVIVSAQDASETEIAVHAPIRIEFRDALGFAEANKILGTLLESLTARYLPAASPPQSQQQDRVR